MQQNDWTKGWKPRIYIPEPETPPVVQKDDDSFFKNLGEGLEQGGKSMLASGAYLAADIGERFTSDDTWAENWKTWAKEYKETAPEADGSVGQFLGSLLPSTIPTVAAIGTAIVAPPLGAAMAYGSLATLGAASMGEGMMTYDEYKESKGEAPDPTARLFTGVAYGVAEYIPEKIGLKFLMKGTKFNPLGKILMKGSDIPAAEQAGKTIIAKLYDQKPELTTQLVKSIIKGGGVESAEEATTQLLTLATDVLYKDWDDNPTWQEAGKQVGMAALGGLIMGAGIGPLSYKAQQVGQRERREKQGFVYLAEDNDTGQALEIVARNKEKGTVTALSPSGEILEDVSETRLGQSVQLTPAQFQNVLKGKLDEVKIGEYEQQQEEAQIIERQTQEFNKASEFAFPDEQGENVLEFAEIPIDGQMVPILLSKKEADPNQKNLVVAYPMAPNPQGGMPLIDLNSERMMVDATRAINVIRVPLEALRPGRVVSDPQKPIQSGESILYEGQEYFVTSRPDRDSVTLKSEEGDIVTISKAEYQELKAATPAPNYQDTLGDLPTDEKGNIISPEEFQAQQAEMAGEEVEDTSGNYKLKLGKKQVETNVINNEVDETFTRKREAQNRATAIMEEYPVVATVEDRTEYTKPNEKYKFKIVIRPITADEAAAKNNHGKRPTTPGTNQGDGKNVGNKPKGKGVEPEVELNPIDSVSKKYNVTITETENGYDVQADFSKKDFRDRELLVQAARKELSKQDIKVAETDILLPESEVKQEAKEADEAPVIEKKSNRQKQEEREASGKKSVGKYDKVLKVQPQNTKQAVIQYFLAGGKINTNSYTKETGFGIESRGQIKGKDQFTAAKRAQILDDNGPTLDVVAMSIAEDLSVQQGYDYDSTQEGLRDTIIEVLLENNTKQQMFDRLMEAYAVDGKVIVADQDRLDALARKQEEEYLARMNDEDYAIYERYGLSDVFELTNEEAQKLLGNEQQYIEYLSKHESEPKNTASKQADQGLEENQEIGQKQEVVKQKAEVEAEKVGQKKESPEDWINDDTPPPFQRTPSTQTSLFGESPKETTETKRDKLKSQMSTATQRLRYLTNLPSEAKSNLVTEEIAALKKEVLRLNEAIGKTLPRDQATDGGQQATLFQNAPKGFQGAATKIFAPFKLSIRDKVEADVQKVIKGWKNPPKVVVWESSADAVFSGAIPGLKTGDLNRFTAFYDPNSDTVHFASDAIGEDGTYRFNSLSKIENTIFHEMFGHYGLRGMIKKLSKDQGKSFTKSFHGLLDEVYKEFGDSEMMADIRKEYKQRPGQSKEAHQRELAEEYIAKIAESNENPTFMEKVISAIRKMISDITGSPSRLTDSEIRIIVANAKKFVQVGDANINRAEAKKAYAEQILSPSEFRKQANAMRMNMNPANAVMQRVETKAGPIDITSFTKNGNLFVMSKSGGIIVGTAMFDSQGIPQAVDVDESYQGNGIATEMYRHAIDQGISIGRSEIKTEDGQAFRDQLRFQKTLGEKEQNDFYDQVNGAEFLEEVEQNYIETGEKRVDADYEKDDAEYNQREVIIPSYTVTWDYDGSSGTNPTNTFDSIKDAYEEAQDANEFYDDTSNHYNYVTLYLKKAWVDENNDIVESGEENPLDDFYYYNKNLPNPFKENSINDSMVYQKDFGGAEDTARGLLEETEKNLGNDIISEYEGFSIKGTTRRKYSYINIYNKEGDEVGSIQLRIADHAYNPSNNDMSANEGNFISVEIANNNKTANKFKGRYSLQYNGDDSYDTILDNVNDRIQEIIDGWGIENIGPMFQQAPATNTQAFKDWFKDSKVVDEKGNPMVVYHGTRKDFDKFDNVFQTFYFAKNPKYADKFTKRGEGGNIMPVYLSIQNPKYVDFEIDFATVGKYMNSKEYLKELPDGLIGTDALTNEQVFVVTNPTQIKSATGNVGAFDGMNEDIRFQKQDYSTWKRNNVTYRGMKEMGSENKRSGMLGRGLYTAPSSNKSMTKEYGKMYFVVNARPKNPKVFQDLNQWEIWFQNELVFPYSKKQGKEFPDIRDFNKNTTIEAEVQKLGFDGIEIKGREMVNFKPENVKYFETEDQLKKYHDSISTDEPRFQQAPPTDSEAFKKWFGDSKVVNPDGSPMVVYHGTNYDFSKFDKNQIGKQFGDLSIGFNFTNKPEIAENYGRAIMPAYVKAENPLIINAGEEGATHVIDQDRYVWAEKIIKSRKSNKPYDSIISKDKDGNMQIVAFSPTQIKSATGNIGTYNPTNPDIRFQNTPDYSKDNFYSNSLKALSNINQNRATGDQWKAMLLNNAASPAELAWIDFDGFLKDNPKPTKEQVYDFIESNQIEIVEVVKGQDQKDWTETEGRIETVDGEFWIDDNGSVYQLHQKGFGLVATAQNIETLKSRANNLDPNNPTKYSQYTLPGGENYREVLLTFPFGKDGWEQYKNVAGGKTYKSPHWDEPNVFAHIRLADHTINDEKVLMVEEVQSDWAQQGKKKGFKGVAEKTDLGYIDYRDELFDKYSISSVDELQGKATANEIETIRQLFKKENDGRDIGINSIPDMPFKQTPQWLNLTLRRVIRMASEEGYDRVAIINGEQSAERYDLSKQVDEIRWYEVNDGYIINGFKNKSSIFNERTSREKLPDLVGKELADKIIKRQGFESVDESGKEKGVLSGVDLKVGGEGMKEFYNSIVPSQLKKVLAKIDKEANLDTVLVDLSNYDTGEPNAQDFVSFKITPRIKNVAMTEGLPMFQKTQTLDNTDEERAAMLSTGLSRWDEVRTKTQDYLLIGKRQLQKEYGDLNLVPDNVNFYNAENVASSKTKSKTDFTMDEFFNPLIESIKDSKASYQEASDYIYARGAISRNKEFVERGIKEREKQLSKIKDQKSATAKNLQKEIDKLRAGDFTGNLESFENNSGMTNQEAQAVIDEFQAKYPKGYKKIFDQKVRLTRRIAEMELEYGLIDQSRFDMKVGNVEYAPLRGFASTHYDPTRMSGDYKAKGRKSKGDDPLAYLAVMAQTVIHQGEQNVVKRHLLDFIEANPDLKLYNIRNAYYVEQVDVNGNVSYLQTYTKPAAGINFKRKLDPTDTLIEPVSPIETETISVMVDGRKLTMEFYGAKGMKLARAVKGADLNKVSDWLKYVGGVNRRLSQLYTTYSPEFTLRNFFRDFITVGINVRNDHGIKTTSEVYSRLPKTLAALKKAVRDKEYSGKYGTYLRQFEESGGLTGFATMQEMAEYKSKAQKLIDNLEKPKVWPLEAWGKALQFIQDYNKVVENGVRLATFITMMEKGQGVQKSIAYSKDVSVNFNRRGEWSSNMGALYLFVNAGIQGTERLSRAFFSMDQKTKTRAIQTAIALPMLSIALGILNRLGAGEDDDGEFYYDKLSDYERQFNLMVPNIMSDKKGDFLKVPLPYGFNVMFAIPDHFMRFLMGKESFGEMSLNTFAVINDSFNPLGGVEFKDDVSGATNLGRILSPTATDPIFDLAFNSNFAGLPIYPSTYPGQPEKPDSQKYFRNVNPVIKSITTKINELTGGDERVPGHIDVSPETIEHLVGSYGGGTYNFVQNMIAFGANLYKEPGTAVSFEDDNIKKVPVIRGYVGYPMDYQNQRLFIENFREIKAKEQTYNGYVKDRRTERAREYRQENNALINLSSLAKQTDKRVQTLKERADAMSILGDQGKANVKKIEEQINNEYLRFNKRYNEVTQGDAILTLQELF